MTKSSFLIFLIALIVVASAVYLLFGKNFNLNLYTLEFLEKAEPASSKNLEYPNSNMGALTMTKYHPGGNIQAGSYTNLRLSENIPAETFSLGGSWAVYDEYLEAGLNGVLEQRFIADKVFLVMKTNDGSTGSVRVFLDGGVVGENALGADVNNGVIEVTNDRLYELIDLKGVRGEYLLRLQFSPGVQIFAFTFE